MHLHSRVALPACSCPAARLHRFLTCGTRFPLLQCAEACRAAFPDEDFMHLAGLLAPLGKLLAHAK